MNCTLIRSIGKKITDKTELRKIWHGMTHDVVCDDKDFEEVIKLLVDDPLSEEHIMAIQHFDFNMEWELENIIRFKFRETDYRNVGTEIVRIQEEQQKGGTVLLSDKSRYIILLIQKDNDCEVNVWEKKASY